MNTNEALIEWAGGGLNDLSVVNLINLRESLNEELEKRLGRGEIKYINKSEPIYKTALSEDVCNIENFDCVVKGRVTK